MCVLRHSDEGVVLAPSIAEPQSGFEPPVVGEGYICAEGKSCGEICAGAVFQSVFHAVVSPVAVGEVSALEVRSYI